jgi:phosphoenolpyruvate carboxylase
LSPDIQNELISVIGNALRQHLTKEIRAAPFFNVMGDSTTDVSKVEKFSTRYRYVFLDFEANTATVRETFLSFIPERDQSAEVVAGMIMSEMKNLDWIFHDAGGKDMTVLLL